jgi:putative membrane protein
MTDIVVHPTMKFVYAGYLLTLAVIVAGGIFLLQYQQAPTWTPAALCVLLLWPLSRQLRRLAVKLTVSSDKLRFETGFLAKSTRTIQLAKVQDVRVDQSLKQRVFGVGTLSIETAGEGSRLAVGDIDQPQALADEIMRRSELAAGVGHGL